MSSDFTGPIRLLKCHPVTFSAASRLYAQLSMLRKMEVSVVSGLLCPSICMEIVSGQAHLKSSWLSSVAALSEPVAKERIGGKIGSWKMLEGGHLILSTKTPVKCYRWGLDPSNLSLQAANDFQGSSCYQSCFLTSQSLAKFFTAWHVIRVVCSLLWLL